LGSVNVKRSSFLHTSGCASRMLLWRDKPSTSYYSRVFPPWAPPFPPFRTSEIVAVPYAGLDYLVLVHLRVLLSIFFSTCVLFFLRFFFLAKNGCAFFIHPPPFQHHEASSECLPAILFPVLFRCFLVGVPFFLHTSTQLCPLFFLFSHKTSKTNRPITLSLIHFPTNYLP